MIQPRVLVSAFLIGAGGVLMAFDQSWINPCSNHSHNNSSTCNDEPCKSCCRGCCNHYSDNPGSPNPDCWASAGCDSLPALCPPLGGGGGVGGGG